MKIQHKQIQERAASIPDYMEETREPSWDTLQFFIVLWHVSETQY